MISEPPNTLTLFWCYRCGFHDLVLFTESSSAYGVLPSPQGSRNHRNREGYVCTLTKLAPVIYELPNPVSDLDEDPEPINNP